MCDVSLGLRIKRSLPDALNLNFEYCSEFNIVFIIIYLGNLREIVRDNG